MWSRWAARLRDVREARLLAWAGTRRRSALVAIGAAALEAEILARAGGRPGEDHRPVRLRDVPFSLLQAVLAAEDHRFFDHPGVDLRGLVRAAWVNFRAGRVAQGGSTITQQLVKNRLLDPKRTFMRKLDE